jgi:hypothetical protein
MNPTPHTLHPAPYTPTPSPSSLIPTPYTLFPDRPPRVSQVLKVESGIPLEPLIILLVDVTV